ncbi:MAG TPA: trypsin-like peptidase domain-containing protein [Kofleriaceae bacterium]|nr:trypsin-like peptidase domain-containing protein [Kofleriaceae bacterium]
MKAHIGLAAVALAAAVAVAPGEARANASLLKSNVVIVKPQYHEKTRVAFRDLSVALGELARQAKTRELQQLLLALASQYQARATSPGHGTGWVWIPPGGGDHAFVVTNKHVAGQAATVTLEFDNARHPAITGGAVIYVDPLHDVAVIEVRRSQLPAQARGFQVSRAPLQEGMTVWASGFPGRVTSAGQRPIYSLTNGIINNAEYPLFEGPEGKVIQHTATIDKGNSGGPLLIQTQGAALGYQVVGMNTWKAAGTNVNLSVPGPVIERAIAAAVDARRIAGDQGRLASELRATAQRLADELGSSRPDGVLLGRMISYSFVAQRPQILTKLLAEALTGKLTEAEVQSFLEDPVEHSRRILWANFFLAFATGESQIGAVRLERITDESRISPDQLVRSVYQIAGKRQEITWVWEHGAWRIADASFEQAFAGAQAAGASSAAGQAQAGQTQPGSTPGASASATATASAPAPGAPLGTPRYVVAARASIGTSSASTDDLPDEDLGRTAGSIGVEIAMPMNRHLWLSTGLALAEHGANYEVFAGDQTFEIDESVWYAQVPALVRLEVGGPSVRLFGKGGLTFDLAVNKGGRIYDNFGNSSSLNADGIEWYEGFNGMNVGLLFGGGIELALGETYALGFDVTSERHLMGERDEDFFTDGANYNFTAIRFGAFLQYRVFADAR